MPRATNSPASRDRRKKILKRAKGYRGAHSKLLKTAKQQVDHSGVYAYRDRKVRKREFRQLWIARVNAAARAAGLTYSAFMHGLKLANLDVNRKMLAEIAATDEAGFLKIVDIVKAKLAAA